MALESVAKPQEDLAQPFLDTVDPGDSETLEILKRMATTKPYHAIMRIVLYKWSPQRRRRVADELLQLKNLKHDVKLASVFEMDPYTQLLWHNLDVKTYYEYINRHKHYVTQGYHFFNDIVISSVKKRLFDDNLLLDEYQPGQDPTDEQIAVHDDSKYSLVETVTYAMRWYPCHGLGRCDDDAWETGLQHHFAHNEHHPEYWGRGPMHWRHLVEAIYDMSAMELERKFGGQPPENKALLLVFDPQYLKRFQVTGQLGFVQRLTRYTMEAYCHTHGQQMPTSEVPL